MPVRAVCAASSTVTNDEKATSFSSNFNGTASTSAATVGPRRPQLRETSRKRENRKPPSYRARPTRDRSSQQQ